MLDYFVTLGGPAETAGGGGVANDNRVLSMLECGLARYRAPDYAATITQMEALVAAYPDSPQAALGRSVIITAKVAEEIGGPPLPVPAPLDVDRPGSRSILFYNLTSEEEHVLLAGPTAHEFTLPGCSGCPPSLDRKIGSCPSSAGRPSISLRLGSGTFQMLRDHPTTPTSVEPLVVNPRDIGICLYIAPIDGVPLPR